MLHLHIQIPIQSMRISSNSMNSVFCFIETLKLVHYNGSIQEYIWKLRFQSVTVNYKFEIQFNSIQIDAISCLRSNSMSFLSIHSRYKSPKQRYLEKTPYEKWLFVRNINVFMLGVVGCEVVEPNYKPNLKTLIPMYMQVNYFVLLAYTCYYYWDKPFFPLVGSAASGEFDFLID